MRVIVVEDEVAMADAVARGLRRDGMAVDVAYDGDSGSEKLSFTRYDVAVLDRDLPGRSGDDLCDEVLAAGIARAQAALDDGAARAALDRWVAAASR